MLLLEDRTGHVVAVTPRLRDHLAARMRADSIDEDLAHGASPDASITVALRAQFLTSTATRRLLAHGLLRATRNAVTPALVSAAAASMNRRNIRDVADDLEELRQCLLAGGPVSVRGVARTRLLLTDGTGPLYNPRAAGQLRARIRGALGAMSVIDY